MESFEGEELALPGLVLIGDDDKKRKRKRKHEFWVRPTYQQCEQLGAFATLVRELRLGDREYFFK